MNGETIEISTSIALGGLTLTLIALVGGVLYRLGALTSRVDGLERRFDEVDRRFDQVDRRFEDIVKVIAEMREENRRNHQQLLQALAHHTHDPATGFAIFRIPPGTENPAG